MMDLSDLFGLLNLLPEPWRTYARAVLQAAAAVAIVSSAITAHTPAWAFKRWPVLRVFSRLSFLAPRDGAGTVKVPGFAPSDPGALEDLARLRRAVEAISKSAAPLMRETQAPPAPREGERGTVRVSVMLSLSGAILVASLAGALLAGCPRLPPVSGCTPLSYRCTDAGRPEVCSSSQRWQPIGDESCAAAGAVCVVDRTAHCAPHAISASADAGVSHD